MSSKVLSFGSTIRLNVKKRKRNKIPLVKGSLLQSVEKGICLAFTNIIDVHCAAHGSWFSFIYRSLIVLLMKPSVNVRLSSLIRAVRIPKHKPLFFTAFFFLMLLLKTWASACWMNQSLLHWNLTGWVAEWVRLAGRRLSKKPCCMSCLSRHSTVFVQCLPSSPKTVHIICL